MNTITTALSFRKKTNNWLHFALCFLTLGLWFWVWLFLLIQAQSHNEQIMREIDMAAKCNSTTFL